MKARTAHFAVWLAVVACARPEPAAQETPLERNRRVAQELLPFEESFTSVVRALEAGDDGLAQQILDRALARGPQGAALERAEAFQRILAGRRLVRALDLRLVCEPRDAGHELEIAFVARHELAGPVTLRTGPASLALLLTAVDRDGDEQRYASSRVHGELGLLELEPGAEQRFVLGSFPVPGIDAIILEKTREIGVTRTDARHRALALWILWSGRRIHRLLPVLPVAIADQHRDGRADRFARSHAGEQLHGILLDLHAPPASVALLATRKLLVDVFGEEWKAGGNAFEDADERLTV